MAQTKRALSRKQPERPSYTRPQWLDFHHTGPDTLAGQYMRMFWHPIYHSEDLPAGRAKPIKIMNVDYTLYRGQDNQPYLVDFRCAHRGMQLSPGWVEDDCIRCFYHGWKFNGAGQCVEQPAEPKPFAQKVRIGAYPCRDYLGLIFAYVGQGAAPPFPRFPQFEDFEGILELDSYYRACNYWNNLENGADLVHSGFVHRNNPGSHDGLVSNPLMDGQESCWGITVFGQMPDQLRMSQIGMPNVFHHKAQPTDFTIAPYREFLAWWVPIDDESHTQFTVAAVRLPPDKAQQYMERRELRLDKRTTAKEELADAVLRGSLTRDDIAPECTDWVRFQDDVAQVGQGAIADHASDRLGQSDRAIIAIRKIWARELRALAEGRPLKEWTYDLEGLDISRGEVWEHQFREKVAT